MEKTKIHYFTEKTKLLKLLKAKYKVKQFTAYQWRINDQIDIYPTGEKWHDIKKNERGNFDTTDLFEFLEERLKGRPNKRSYNQNSYYWGVVIKMIVDHVQKMIPLKNVTPQPIHTRLKTLFLPEGITSTTQLSKMKMEEYMTKVRNFALLKFSIEIPLPNECQDQWQSYKPSKS
jgi:hypothetical protein